MGMSFSIRCNFYLYDLLFIRLLYIINELFSYSPRSFPQRPPSTSRPSSGEQRRHRSDHLLPTTSSRNRSKHRSNSNDSRRSGSATRARSSSLTKRSPSPAGYYHFLFVFILFIHCISY